MPRTASADHASPAASPGAASRPFFSLGRFGLPINVIAVIWGLFVVDQHRLAATGDLRHRRWGRFAAPLATLALIVPGAVYYLLFQRKRTGILAKHAADPVMTSSNSTAASDSLQVAARKCRILEWPGHCAWSREIDLSSVMWWLAVPHFKGQHEDSPAMVKLQVRRRRKASPPREVRPPGRARAVPGMVRPRLHSARAWSRPG